MRKVLQIVSVILFFTWQNSFAQTCEVGEEQIVIKVDANENFGAQDFSWSLVDENNNTLINYGTNVYSSSTVTRDTLCLVNGNTYTFRAFDDFGSGWNQNGQSLVSIYYGADQFPLYFDSPNNGNLDIGLPEAEFSFVAGEKPGLACAQPKEIGIYEPQLLDTRFFNTITAFSDFDSGKDVILRFTPPSDDSYTFNVSDVSTPTRVSLTLLTACLGDTPSLIATDSASFQAPFSLTENLIGGTPYYLVFSNDAINGGADTARARLEISYSGALLSDNCGVTATMDSSAAIIARFAEASPGASISFNTNDGVNFSSDPSARDISYTFDLTATDVVVEVTDYPPSAELFARLSFGGCPTGSMNFSSVTYEGTTRRFNFNLTSLGVNVNDQASLSLIEGYSTNNQPFGVRIRSRANVEAEFPVNPNDNCATALDIPVSDSGEFPPKSFQLSNYNASNSGLAAPCAQDSIYTTGDVWVKAVVPQTGILAILADGEYVDNSQEDPLQIAWALYTGSCGALNEYYCPSVVETYQADTVAGLTPGEEVFVRLFDRGGLRQGDFNISMQESIPLDDPNLQLSSFIDSVHIQFTTSSFYFDHYLLDISIDSFATFLPGYENLQVNKSTSSLGVPGLTANTKYYFRVKKVSSKIGDSRYFFEARKTNPIIFSTIDNGDWNDPTIWLEGTVPTADKGVNIFHKVDVLPGADITIEEVTIKHAFDSIGAIGLYIQDASFRVERDIDVLEENNSYSNIIDTLGIIITNNSGLDKVFSVGGSVLLQADQSLETQFMFHALNTSGNLEVNIGKDFTYQGTSTYSLSEYGENIFFDNTNFLTNRIIINNNSLASAQNQSFKAVFNNSTVKTVDGFTIEDLANVYASEQTYFIHFTGNSILELGGNFYKPYGGDLIFFDNSTVNFNGTYDQFISSFDPSYPQDSTIWNNVIFDNVNLGDIGQVSNEKLEANIFLLPNPVTGNGEMFIKGEINFLNGIVKADGSAPNLNLGLYLTETATLSPSYDISSKSYFMGPITKVGLSDFLFPVGNKAGPQLMEVSNISTLNNSSAIKIAAFSDYCQDSVFNFAGGFTHIKEKDFWVMESNFQESLVQADFRPIFPDLTKTRIGNINALRLMAFDNGTSYNVNASTANSFTSTYNFDDGLNRIFGIGSLDGSNNFYQPIRIIATSTQFAKAGENITFTYNGAYASSADVVYFKEVAGTTVASTANSITVQVPSNARSGEPVIVLANNTILQSNVMINISQQLSSLIRTAQFDSLSILDNIGTAAFGYSKIAVTDINNNAELDIAAIRQNSDSIYFMKDLLSAQQINYFREDDVEPGEKVIYKDLQFAVSNAFGETSVDISSYVQYFNQQIPVYFANDGLGNYQFAQTSGFETITLVRSPIIRDIDGDGYNDLSYYLNLPADPYNGLNSTAFENNELCPVNSAGSFYTRGDQQLVNHLSYGNFTESGQLLNYVYIGALNELSLFDYSIGFNQLATISTSGNLSDFQEQALNADGKAQLIALDTINKTLEIFDAFSNGTINNSKLQLSFTPARFAMEDLTGDGFPDAVISEKGSSAIYFYENDGLGSFALVDSLVLATANIVDVEIADIDEDGYRDLLVLTETGDIVAVYYNLLAVPDAPIVNASNVTTSTFDINWLPVAGAASYQIEVSLSSDTAVSLLSDSILNTTDTFLLFNAPIAFEAYYIHARSINLAGDTSAYAAAVPATLQQITPTIVVASNITTSSFDMNWLPTANVSAYEIELSLSSDTAINLVSDSIFYTSDTLLSFNAPSAFETYYIHARGISSVGDTSFYSAPVAVALQSLVAPSVTLSAIDGNTLGLTVGAVDGADSYELMISLDGDSINNDPNDNVLIVTDGLNNFIVPEYSENYFVYAKSIASGVDTTAYTLVGNVKLPVSPYLEMDSLALLSLYNSTDGANWTNNEGWLTQKVNQWYGISMSGDTIQSIDLSGNNLKNSVSDSLSLMNHLESINIANNALSSLGNITALANQLISADVSNNGLSFEELEILQSTPSYQFGGQQYQYPTIPDTLINLDESILINTEAGATSNTYQWFKNNVALASATSLDLLLNNATKADEGRYHLQLSNSDFAGLIFFSDTVELRVSTLERDIAALKSLYQTANGAAWTTVQWDTTQVNPVNWNASATDIVVENNRIVEVNLPNNNLVGSVSPRLREMLGLRIINLSANKISTLPRLTRLPAITTLNMNGNQLGYEDIEPNVNITGFSFQDQMAVGTESTVSLAVGSEYAMDYEFGGAANTYQWYRNGLAISGQLMDSIVIDSLIYENMGSYQLKVRNSIINAKYPSFELSSAVQDVFATATVSGKVNDANGFATTEGKLNLFKITSEGAYDSVRFEDGGKVINLNSDGTYQINNLRLGDYILFIKPNKNLFPQLLSTYYPNTIDWDVADELNIRANEIGVDVIMEGTPQALNGTSSFLGYVEVEVPETANGRKLPRQRLSGTGVSVRRLGNSNKGISAFNGELVAFIETDENGEFHIDNLPAGEYISKVDYPGIPMDEGSDIRFTLTGENLESLKVEAIVDNGVCTMNTILYTAVKGSKEIAIVVYPNPFEHQITISGEINEIRSLAIYDVSGQLKIKYDAKEIIGDGVIDLSSLSSGIYFLTVNWWGGSSSSSKIIKK